MSIKAIVFDMDGVLIDNNPYHKSAWKIYCEKYKLSVSEADFIHSIWGKSNEEILKSLYGEKISLEFINEHTEIKESLYREVISKEIKPLNGLYEILELLKINKFKLGIATSAPRSNLDFLLEHLPIRHYFDVMIDGCQVTRGKPSPEVYNKALKGLSVSAENCIAFEDSIPGVISAKSAGIKVIGVTTTHTAFELRDTEMTIQDFTEIEMQQLEKILRNKSYF